MDTNYKYNAISLFSGMGGDSLAIHNTGGNLIGYSEIEKSMRDTHDLNFPNCKLIGNGVAPVRSFTMLTHLKKSAPIWESNSPVKALFVL